MTNKSQAGVAKLSKSQVPETFSDFKSLDSMLEWGTTMIDGGFLPSSISEPESVVTIVTMGNELGLKPMIALQNLHVIANRPTLSSAIIGSLLHRANIEFELKDNYAPIKNKDGKVINRKTTYKFYYESKLIKGKIMEQEFTVTWKQMEKAGYTEKDNWEKYPQEMMRARCMAYACRALFPWVLSGMYTELEINDIAAKEGFDEAPVTITSEGEIVIEDAEFEQMED